MRLGFACGWESPPEPTWSHTPWNLRAALAARVEVVDLGITYPLPVRVGLKAACARRYDGRWVSMWRHSRAARSYGERVLSRAAAREPVDAVLQIQDLAHFDERPYLLYQDLSYDVLLEQAQAPGGLTHFPTLSMDAVLRLRDRQREIYANAAGVLAMSRWFADHLVDVSGVPAARVHVVHPGASAVDSSVRPDDAAVLRRRAGPRRRLLFVGRDFHTKAGSVVVAALAVLRREHDPEITLTVVGPSTWPMPGEVPAGVDFRGLLPVREVAALYDSHDLFVLPSRFEGFGIAFVEALAHGLPCVGRRAFAMPEIITPGVNGDLVVGDDPADLAGRIAVLLADDALYDRVAESAAGVVEHYSWGRAADDVLTVARVVA
jgi:glycosyltransferase involved in cell wall biosynthesis